MAPLIAAPVAAAPEAQGSVSTVAPTNALERVFLFPVVSDGVQHASNMYSNLKERNEFVRQALTQVETNVAKIAASATPVAAPVLKPIDNFASQQLSRLEESYPIVKEPTEVLAQELRTRVDGVRSQVQQRVETVKSSATERLETAKAGAAERFEKALTATESAVDQLLPEEEAEEEATAAEAEEETVRASSDRVSTMSSKVRRRLHNRAMAGMKNAQMRSRKVVESMHFVDLIQYAQDNIDAPMKQIRTQFDAANKAAEPYVAQARTAAEPYVAKATPLVVRAREGASRVYSNLDKENAAALYKKSVDYATANLTKENAAALYKKSVDYAAANVTKETAAALYKKSVDYAAANVNKETAAALYKKSVDYAAANMNKENATALYNNLTKDNAMKLYSQLSEQATARLPAALPATLRSTVDQVTAVMNQFLASVQNKEGAAEDPVTVVQARRLLALGQQTIDRLQTYKVLLLSYVPTTGAVQAAEAAPESAVEAASDGEETDDGTSQATASAAATPVKGEDEKGEPTPRKIFQVEEFDSEDEEAEVRYAAQLD